MNPATLRPHPHVSRVTPEPIHAELWYECQTHDTWGAQHGSTIYKCLGDDGRYYQWISYMDYEPDSFAGLVLHGPAPKSWIDNPDSYTYG